MGGPAEAAGIAKDDVIVKFNSHDIRTRDDLPYFVGLLKPGTEASLEVIRAGKMKTLKVKVGNLEDAAKPLALSPAATDEGGRLGLVVGPLDAKVKRENKIDSGVLVQKASGVAKAARLQAGDIIVSIGGQALNTPQDLARLEAILPPNRPLPVLVVREGQQSFFTLRLDP
jgi:serine protease Do